MAYQNLGDTAKARQHFDTAKLGDKASWQQCLLYRRLRQEAAELLTTDSKPMR